MPENNMGIDIDFSGVKFPIGIIELVRLNPQQRKPPMP